jgi:dienelactone hydrolase
MHRRSLRRPRIGPRVLAVIAGAAVVGAAALAEVRSAPARARANGGGSAVVLSLPAAAGRSRVGTVSLPVADRSRPGGETMIQLFYPTPVRHGAPAAYLSPKTAQLTAATLHVPLTVLERIVTHALSGPRVAAGAHPVVLFSPGLTELRSDDTAMATDLASRGYVVVAIDHPEESAVVEFPSGRVIPGSFTDGSDPAVSARLRAAAVRARVRDVAAVLRALHAIDRDGRFRDRLDLTHIGMFGFSIGGATTDEAMHAIPQIRAGVDLDGSLYGRSLTTPLYRPFLLRTRDGHSTTTDSSLRDGWANLRGFRREIMLIGAGHGDFTDLAGLIQQYIPGFSDPSGYYGPIPAARASSATRELLSAFFDHTLLSHHRLDALLDHPERLNRDLLRLR